MNMKERYGIDGAQDKNKKQEMNHKVKRVEILKLIADIIYSKHKDELFLNKEYEVLYYDVIKHESIKAGLDDINDIEINFIKNNIKSIYKK